ncbi:glycosyltransferase [Paeniroseomonas aquatica]|uniref:Glycosyltransferase n=1 Tax=Paeniroseomonas aquatica TaxID=373043 RepID=A0ABT8AG53_9PROT|nr:glycosyltransferase [Paeniroseomonas aquatica]MDN3568776.1 glycosyltransferase [Paeniroseomonas aquatica]
MDGAVTTVGVLVPNYNYAEYLPERLASIRMQDRPVDSVVFLDDASTDRSWDIAQVALQDFTCPVIAHAGIINSGNILRQWQLGLEQMDTDLAWIAEADDRATPSLLASLVARFEGDSKAILAFCDSSAIGAQGEATAANSQAYYAAHGDNGLAQDGVFDAAKFAERFLCPRNLLVSASATLWRRSVLIAALARLKPEMPEWLCAGDWRTYVEACEPGGMVHFVAAPLNEHRRHSASVTGSTPRSRHFAEVVAMHFTLRRRFGPQPERDAAMRRHLVELRQAWALMPQLDGAGP